MWFPPKMVSIILVKYTVNVADCHNRSLSSWRLNNFSNLMTDRLSFVFVYVDAKRNGECKRGRCDCERLSHVLKKQTTNCRNLIQSRNDTYWMYFAAAIGIWSPNSSMASLTILPWLTHRPGVIRSFNFVVQPFAWAQIPYSGQCVNFPLR